MRSRQRKNHLTIFLIKNGIDQEKVAKKEKDISKIKIDQKATLYLRPSHSNSPMWLRFFEDKIDARTIGLFNASSSALLLVKRDNRIFGLAFGQGRHLLEDGVIEQTFGLRVVLNAIDPEKIRAIDKDSLDIIGRKTREQVNKEESISSFGLNVDRDLIRAVTGKTNDERLGARLHGSDSLALSVPSAVSDVAPLLSECLKLYQSTAYKKKPELSWVDCIGEVRDPLLHQKLDERLAASVRKKEVNKIWLAVPVLLEWSKIRGFRYKGWHDKEVIDDIYMPQFMERCPRLSELTVDLLNRWKIECIDAATDEASHVWNLYNCIYAEISYDKGFYLLSGGKWYRVDRDYVEQVNRAVQSILRNSSKSLVLPAYSDDSEEDYNKRVSRANKRCFACVDRKTISHGGGRSRLEFCDIYTNHREMIHVKRYSGSSVLSHLFAQGVVSAETFTLDANLREKINAKLPAGFKFKNPRAPIDSSRYEVVYGIISKSKEELELPFFSRVTLRNAYNRLNLMRYKISVVKIQDET